MIGLAEREKKERWKTTFTAPGARILLVDDNRVNLKMSEGLLRPYHMQVQTAEGGKRAVEMVQNQEYDLIFMDYMMPDMNGADTTKKIRGMEGGRYRNLVIVALSANVEEDIREIFWEAGMNDFVAKPIERRSMDKILCKWLPQDLIMFSQDRPEEERNTTGKEDLSTWKMDGIDVEIGMSYLDNDRALYLEVLTDFADSIEEKAYRIECAAKERNLTAYIMGVHSLKSAAGYLGAVALADMAKALEAEAKSSDWEAIERRTPSFLLSYRQLYQSIEPYRIDRSYTGKKKRVDKKEVLTLLDKLSACMEEYDIDGGEEVVQALEEYDFKKAWLGHMDRIRKAAGRFDYDVCKEAADSFKQALEKES